MQRTIKTDRYEISPNVWELNGEPMETAGEVIANISLVMEHLEREARRS